MPALVPKWSKIATCWSQHRAKIEPKTVKIEPRWGPKIGYPIAPVSEKIERKHQRNKEEGSTSQRPPPCAKKWPTWPQLGSQVEVKMDKKSMQKSIKNLMASWHRFWSDFGRFWVPSWSAKSTKNQSKIASKKRLKKGR